LRESYISIVCLAAALCLPALPEGALADEPPAVDEAALRAAADTPEAWLTHGRDYAETRFSPLAAIDSDNVNRLGLAWQWDTGTFRGLEATPLVANGVLYATAPWSEVFALDARTGELRWRWDPQVPRSHGRVACCDVVNRGVALYDGKIYVGVLDGRLAALDAETGEIVWSVQTTDPEQPYAITGAPRVVKGNVIIGNGGAEYGVRGYVSAYDADTGALSWRFYTVPGDPSEPFESPALEQAAETWTGEWWTMGGGGTVWDSMAYDPEADLLYVGTGNGAPWARDARSPGGGDNLYLASILALNPDDGELVWYYQTTPGDTWDYTAVQHMILADLMIDGRERQVLMQAPKNGFFYVLDRITGELISAEPYSTVTWASRVDPETGRPVENSGARYGSDTPVLVTPGPGGAHNWNPMSFNPMTGLVYIPASAGGFPYLLDAEFEYRPGVWNTGVDLKVPALPHRYPTPVPPEGAGGEADLPPGSLLAWDPVEQRPRWRVPYTMGANGGTLTTAGNLVFQGTADGRFLAYSADRGELLWEVTLGNSVIAAPVTYELDGEQYVTVLAGWGGAVAGYGLNPSGMYKAEGRVWSFKLDGERAIEPARSQPRPPLTPIAFEATEEILLEGEELFAGWCAVCHGRAAASGGMIADLRYSPPGVFESYSAIVRDGAYESLGMPKLGEWLTENEVDAIRLYVLSQRQALLDAD
jgi:quinohemoprotein ethanol dehydrogenase